MNSKSVLKRVLLINHASNPLVSALRKRVLESAGVEVIIVQGFDNVQTLTEAAPLDAIVIAPEFEQDGETPVLEAIRKWMPDTPILSLPATVTPEMLARFARNL